jgi:cytochrome c553
LVFRLLGRSVAVLLLVCSTLGAARAQDVGDKLELCMSCHGETGKPQVQGVPALAGRSVQDLSAQLRLFRDGQRQNPQMVMAKRLADEEIEALAAYFARQDPKSGS